MMMRYHFRLNQDLTEKQAKIFFVVFMLALGLADNLEVADLEAESEHYKKLVCEGSVPDYKEIKSEC